MVKRRRRKKNEDADEEKAEKEKERKERRSRRRKRQNLPVSTTYLTLSTGTLHRARQTPHVSVRERSPLKWIPRSLPAPDRKASVSSPSEWRRETPLSTVASRVPLRRPARLVNSPAGSLSCDLSALQTPWSPGLLINSCFDASLIAKKGRCAHITSYAHVICASWIADGLDIKAIAFPYLNKRARLPLCCEVGWPCSRWCWCHLEAGCLTTWTWRGLIWCCVLREREKKGR